MRAPRICFRGGIFHVVTRCNDREFLFKDDEDFRLFLQILLRAKKLYKVHIFAYCLTHNHVHLIVGTLREPNLSKFMQYLNGNFAKSYNRKHNRTGHFWGERFHSTVIESESQLFFTLIYIELNLVRCRAVDDPADWKWSSYRAHAFGEEDPVLDFHELYLSLGASPEQRQEIYRAMVADRIREKGLSREPVFSSGVILGSRSFVEGLLEILGRNSAFYQNRKPHPYAEETYSLRRFAPVS